MLNIFKFVIFVLLLPLVYACSISFIDYFKQYPPNFQDFILYGVFGFFIIFFFIYQFWGLYESGQKMKLGMFKILAPFDRLISNILPFHFLGIMILFYIVHRFFDTDKYDVYFLFFAGFAMAMHIILVAQDMQEQEKSPVKPDYMLHIALVIILNTIIFTLMVDFVRQTWTFPKFANTACTKMIDVWKDGIKRLSH